ncbi:MAG: formylmethanofuran dehydrogenase subunit A [Candidatus Bathyarchaeia archaeon]
MGRLLRPDDHERDHEVRTATTRSGVGHTVPSTFTTGYRYARMGYTTVIEPASPPLKQRHTHHELNDTPIVDKACFPLVGNNWIVMDLLSRGDVEGCAAFLAWLVSATKGYALKVVNPGGIEAWGWGRNVQSLDDQVPRFNITPREIIRGLCRANIMLNMPHRLHLHTNRVGIPGNYETTLKTMHAVRDLARGDEPILHITHCQFSAYAGGSTWLSVESGAEKVARYVNAHPHVSLDLGQVVFTDVTTMTADGPFQHGLHLLTGNKWCNADVENETGSGIVPFKFSRGNVAHSVQWAIGLELALLVKDPWRVYMTTDHPNAGPFTAYPRVITWLTSRVAREKTMAKVVPRAMKRCVLPSIDREYSLSEVAIVTRAATAKALGLGKKGHLGVGADADIAVYDFNPKQLDPSRDYRKLRRALRKTVYTVKDGVLVAKNGEILRQPAGRTYWARVHVPDDLQRATMQRVVSSFEQYYTVQLENYAIREEELASSAPLDVKPTM